MKFTNSLIKGKLLKRYKRFFADIKVNNKIITAHCPNTGSMQGLLDKGNEVLLTEHNDPKRKLKFTLEIIKARKEFRTTVIVRNIYSEVLNIVQAATMSKLSRKKYNFKEKKYLNDALMTSIAGISAAMKNTG